MGLRESRILNEVHPWLAVRLRWLGEVARLLRGGQSLISGVRTPSAQLELYNNKGARPVAYPGCSQHQYGFAADATYLPFAGITSKGRPRVSSTAETQAAMEGFARQAGLTTVRNDPGHLQIYPASMFLPWAVSRGLCPAQPPPPVRRSLVTSFCGEEGVSVGFGALTGFTCGDPVDNFNLFFTGGGI